MSSANLTVDRRLRRRLLLGDGDPSYSLSLCVKNSIKVKDRKNITKNQTKDFHKFERVTGIHILIIQIMHIQILKLIFSIKIPYKDIFSKKNILTYTGNKIMPKILPL